MSNTTMLIRWILVNQVIKGRPGKILVILLGIWGLKKVADMISLWLHSQKMENIRKRFRKECRQRFKVLEEKVLQDSIPKDEVARITGMDLDTLVSDMKKGYIRPSRVLAAYQAKALEVHYQTNCLIHPLEEADALALSLEQADQEKRDSLPLYGVPISIKDDYGLKGYTAALGMANLLELRAEEDCNIVRVLKNAGAVPFVKTNTPHAAFSLMCSNPVTGETTHPMDKTRTPGGSSGGESALVSGGGSILGMGSDIGGSLREPAAICGICTIRPSVHRTSHLGLPFSHEQSGQDRMCTSSGPMARDTQSLVRCCRALFVPDLYQADMNTPPVPFNEELFQRKTPLRVGMLSGDQLFPVSPPAKRALAEARTALEARGHTVVDWNPPGLYAGPHYYLRTVCGDSAEGFKQYMRGDPPDWCLKAFFDMLPGQDSWWTRAKIKFNSLRDPHFAELQTHCIGTNSLLEYWGDTAGLEKFRRYVEKCMRDAGLDSIICPSWPSCAPRSAENTYLQLIVLHSHVLLWSAMNVPCGVLPVSKVKEEDIQSVKEWNPECSPWIREKTKEELLSGVGLPLGTMVCALRWQEETVLRTMIEIEEGLKTL